MNARLAPKPPQNSPIGHVPVRLLDTGPVRFAHGGLDLKGHGLVEGREKLREVALPKALASGSPGPEEVLHRDGVRGREGRGERGEQKEGVHLCSSD